MACVALGATWWWTRIVAPPPLALTPVEILASAGQPFRTKLGAEVELDGTASRLTPLEFITGDGNHENEDKLLWFRDGRDLVTIGPLLDPWSIRRKGRKYGWPTDLELVDGVLYGIDAYCRRMFMVDVRTGRASPLRFDDRWTALQCLAYDPKDDVFYAVDGKADVLLRAPRRDGLLDIGAGRFTEVGKVEGDQFTGLALEPGTGRLVACDAATSTLHWIDPATGATIRQIPLEPKGDLTRDEMFDELAFHGGELYGAFRFATFDAQIRRIDAAKGTSVAVSPIIRDASTHSLVMIGVPETVRWTVESGPPGAVIEHPDQLKTAVRFAEAGSYVFRITLTGAGRTSTDTVQIDVVTRP